MRPPTDNAALQPAQGEHEVAAESVASSPLGQNLSRLQAPAAGVLLRAPERFGAAVSPDGAPLFVIGAPLRTVPVDATLSETEGALIKPGQIGEILASALANESFPGKVQPVFIEPEMRDDAVLYPVRRSAARSHPARRRGVGGGPALAWQPRWAERAPRRQEAVGP